MSGIHNSITELIGHTPLLRLHNVEREHNLQAELVAKLEFFNPNQNIKDRIALSMIEAAEKSGKINKETTIVEITSGNTGIGVAAIAAAKGYKFRSYVQDSAPVSRTLILKAFGADVRTIFASSPAVAQILVETGGDFVAAVKALIAEIEQEDNVYVLNQLNNPANPEIHRKTTGPEIWEDTGGKVDYFIAGVGTGGTVSGVGAFLKEKNPNVKIVALQPAINSRPTPQAMDVPEIFGVHAFEGVPEAWIPTNLNRAIYDEYYDIETTQAYEKARELAKLEGILTGISSGATLQAAVNIAQKPENKGKRIVFILADSGLFYLTNPLYAIYNA